MFRSISPTPQTLAPLHRHEFAYPAVTQVAVRAHTVLASSLRTGADRAPVRRGPAPRGR